MKIQTNTLIGPMIRGLLFSISLWIPAVTAQESIWTPPANVDLATVRTKVAERAETDERIQLDPTILAYRTALFLSSGQFDKPTIGPRQSILAEFASGERNASIAIITIEFMGYPDDSLFGERFTIRLTQGDDETWSLGSVQREGYGRGDHR